MVDVWIQLDFECAVLQGCSQIMMTKERSKEGPQGLCGVDDRREEPGRRTQDHGDMVECPG